MGTGLDPVDGRYLRARSRSRSCGTVVELYDTRQPENVFDPDGGRWVTICEHGYLANHDLLANAKGFMAEPNAWCEECYHAMLAKEARR
jgi:hypothetical protein